MKPEIKYIDIVCHSALGYSNQNPYALKEKEIKNLHKAVIVADESEKKRNKTKFNWTITRNSYLYDYLKRLDKAECELFFNCILNGSVDVCGMAYDMSSLLSEEQAVKTASWLPDDIREKLNISSVMFRGVGGVSSSSMIHASKRGVKYLWAELSPNVLRNIKTPPFLFSWKLSKTEKVLVFLSDFSKSFETLLQNDGNVRYRELFNTDRQNMIKSNNRILGCIDRLQKNGYEYTSLPVSFPVGDSEDFSESLNYLISFVEKWNEMNLRPLLRLSSLTFAMSCLDIESANRGLPTYTGEWNDYLSKNTMSMPEAVSIFSETVRKYKKSVRLNGGSSENDLKLQDSALRDMCIFSENTFYTGNFRTDMNENLDMVYNYKLSKLLSAENKLNYLIDGQIRNFYEDSESGFIYIYNPYDYNYSDFVKIPSLLISRCPFVRNKNTGICEKVYYQDDGAGFWADIPPNGLHVYEPLNNYDEKISPIIIPQINVSDSGYPDLISWGGVSLSCANLGEFLSVSIDGEMKREVMRKIVSEKSISVRSSLVSHYVELNSSVYASAERSETFHTVVYEQAFENSLIMSGKRTLTIWKTKPHIRVKVEFFRPYSVLPESFYIRFLLDKTDPTAVMSHSGQVFEAGRGQLDGSLLDYIATDGWLSFPYSDILWLSKDAPVVSLGGLNYFADIGKLNSNVCDIYSCVFDNTLENGFKLNSHGKMSFIYDILLNGGYDNFSGAKSVSEAVYAEPVISVKL